MSRRYSSPTRSSSSSSSRSSSPNPINESTTSTRSSSIAFATEPTITADGPVTRVVGNDVSRKPGPSPTGTNYPVNDIKTYRDLLIFEERLKQNLSRLKKRKQKYQIFLSCLVTGIIWLSFRVLLQPSKYPFIQFLHMIFLLISIVTLILFFVSGLYKNKIIIASRYVPQCNRSLRPFNMHFRVRGSPKEAGELTFHSKRVPESVREGYARYRRSYWQKRRMFSEKLKNERNQMRREQRWRWLSFYKSSSGNHGNPTTSMSTGTGLEPLTHDNKEEAFTRSETPVLE